MSELLFGEPKKPSTKIYQTGENHFEWWENAITDEMIKVKATMNEWFVNYPDEHKTQLKADFKNKFNDAWYELFIHQLFFLQGFHLEVHPEVPNSKKHPDFLATKNGYSIYIEAKVITGRTEKQMKMEIVRETIIDRLQKIDLPNHLLSLDKLEFKDNSVPSLKGITKWIESKISEINVPEILTDSDFSNREIIKFENEKVLIELRVLSSNVKSIVPEEFEDHRPIGIIYYGTEFITGGDVVIQSAFREKALRYGELDKPLLLCFNLSGWRLDLVHDVNRALLSDIGEETGFWATNPPKYSRVSAALFTNASPSDRITYKHRLILHPAPKFIYHFDYSLLTFETVRTKTDVHERRDINDIFTK